jgi:hypothetical protein
MSIKNALDSFGFDVVEGAKVNLKRKNKNASKKLSDSLDYSLKVRGNKDKFVLKFSMATYGEYIDRGVKGAGGKKKDGSTWKKKRISNKSIWKQGKGYTDKKPPASAFSGWIVRRGIAPRNNKGQFTTRKGLQFAIATSVYHTGIEATEFFTQAYNKAFKNLPDTLAIAFANELELKIKL